MSKKIARSHDGVKLKKGDKAWMDTQSGLEEIVIGKHLPWTKKFIAKAQYCWASKKKAEDWRSGKHLTRKDRELLCQIFG